MVGLAALVLLLCSTSGCWALARPNWCHPGPERYQQAKAVRYDPYPDPDIGPAVVGGRPLGYLEPLPEVEQARWAIPGVR